MGAENINCEGLVGFKPGSIVFVRKEYNSNDFCSYDVFVDDKSRPKKKMPIGVIIAIVVAVVVTIVALIIVTIMCIKKRNRKNDQFEIHQDML